ncbi:MAG: hypothetical protein AAGF11_25310 [Myxococcota bacterium]
MTVLLGCPADNEPNDDAGATSQASSTNATSWSVGTNADTGNTNAADSSDSTAGASECGDPGTNSEVMGDQCFCNAGFEWCNDDPQDYMCCPIPSGTGEDDECGAPGTNSQVVGDVCVCISGYEWCNPNDPNDLTCCERTDTSTG